MSDRVDESTSLQADELEGETSDIRNFPPTCNYEEGEKLGKVLKR